MHATCSAHGGRIWAEEGDPKTILQAREKNTSPNEDEVKTYCTKIIKIKLICFVFTTYGHVLTFFMNERIMCPKSLLL